MYKEIRDRKSLKLINIYTLLRWAGKVAKMEECRTAIRILTGTSTGKINLRRPRRRWEDNITMEGERERERERGRNERKRSMEGRNERKDQPNFTSL